MIIRIAPPKFTEDTPTAVLQGHGIPAAQYEASRSVPLFCKPPWLLFLAEAYAANQLPGLVGNTLLNASHTACKLQSLCAPDDSRDP
jgi:hypothetical protein